VISSELGVLEANVSMKPTSRARIALEKDAGSTRGRDPENLLHKFDLPSEGISNPSAVTEGPDGSFYGSITGAIAATFAEVVRLTPGPTTEISTRVLCAMENQLWLGTTRQNDSDDPTALRL
jgi:hypothetical protein